MNEIFPIVGGVLAGGALGGLAPLLRWSWGLLLVLGLGIAATVLSGEYRLGWGFVLLDVPLVGLSAVAGFLVSRSVRVRVTGTRAEQT